MVGVAFRHSRRRPRTERLPQLSRAPDGTVWLAWLRDSNSTRRGFAVPALLAARLVGGVWSAPETVAVDSPATQSEGDPTSEFSILGVSQDEAWLTWGVAPDGDPFSSDRDLVYAGAFGRGLVAPQPLANSALAETRPVLVETTNGSPVAIMSFRSVPSLLRAVRWTGSGGWSQTPDDLTATAFYGFDAAPDTNGAVRLVAILREDVGTQCSQLEDHIQELVLNDSGFTRAR